MGLCYYNKVMGVKVSLCGGGIPIYSVISQFDVRKYMNNRRKRPCVGLCHLNRVAKAKVAIEYFPSPIPNGNYGVHFTEKI